MKKLTLLVCLLFLAQLVLLSCAKKVDSTKKLTSKQEKNEKPALLFAQGMGHVKKYEWNKAVNAFKTIISLKRNASSAYFNLGYCHEQLGNYQAAIGAYKQALKYDPNNLSIVLNLGNTMASKGNFVQGKSLYQKYLKKDAYNVKILNNLASLYLKEKRFDAAINTVQKLLSRHPQNVEAYMVMFNIYFIQDKLNLAQTILENAKKLKKITKGIEADIENNLGMIYMKRGKRELAWKHFHKAIEINSNHYRANFNIGAISIKYRDYKSASKYFSIAIKRRPGDALARLSYGFALQGEARGKEAARQFNIVMNLKSDSKDKIYAEALYSLAQVTRFLLNKREDAIKLYTNYLQLRMASKKDMAKQALVDISAQKQDEVRQQKMEKEAKAQESIAVEQSKKAKEVLAIVLAAKTVGDTERALVELKKYVDICIDATNKAGSDASYKAAEVAEKALNEGRMDLQTKQTLSKFEEAKIALKAAQDADSYQDAVTAAKDVKKLASEVGQMAEMAPTEKSMAAAKEAVNFISAADLAVKDSKRAEKQRAVETKKALKASKIIKKLAKAINRTKILAKAEKILAGAEEQLKIVEGVVKDVRGEKAKTALANSKESLESMKKRMTVIKLANAEREIKKSLKQAGKKSRAVSRAKKTEDAEKLAKEVESIAAQVTELLAGVSPEQVQEYSEKIQKVVDRSKSNLENYKSAKTEKEAKKILRKMKKILRRQARLRSSQESEKKVEEMEQKVEELKKIVQSLTSEKGAQYQDDGKKLLAESQQALEKLKVKNASKEIRKLIREAKKESKLISRVKTLDQAEEHSKNVEEALAKITSLAGRLPPDKLEKVASKAQVIGDKSKERLNTVRADKLLEAMEEKLAMAKKYADTAISFNKLASSGSNQEMVTNSAKMARENADQVEKYTSEVKKMASESGADEAKNMAERAKELVESAREAAMNAKAALQKLTGAATEEKKPEAVEATPKNSPEAQTESQGEEQTPEIGGELGVDAVPSEG